MADERVQVRLRLPVAGQKVSVTVEADAAPGPSEMLLPALRSLSASFGTVGERYVEAQGKSISCGPGCGACCRQMVGVSASDARQLVSLLRSMPDERLATLRQRAIEGVERLRAAGLDDCLTNPNHDGPEAAYERAIAYMKVGVPCVFLENEMCSIHAERPLVCREYLVTSDPRHCARPWADREFLEPVPLPYHMNRAMVRVDQDADDDPWSVLLMLVYRALVENVVPPRGVERPGEEWLKRFVNSLGSSRVGGDLGPAYSERMSESNALQVGQPAPDFELMDDEQQTVKLSDLRGKTVVLLFYPMDFSSVCTAEHCTFGPKLSDINGGREDTVVFGINCDHPFSHAAYRKQYDIPYHLLSDPTRQTVKAYGMFAGVEPFNCSKRGTVVIDPAGNVAAWEPVEILEERKVEDLAKYVAAAK